MAKRNAKAQKSNELDGAEFFAAIRLIEQEKGIPKEYMIEKITQALVSAYKKDHEGAGDNITVDANEELGTVRMFIRKNIVEVVDDPDTEMSLEEAREKLPAAGLGDVVRMEIKTRDFGRIAAQTARQVIIQGMREAERGMIYDEFSSKEHELLTGMITRIDPRSGGASLRIGSGTEATEAFLSPGEQVRGESYVEGMRLKVYVVEVRRANKGPQVLISRTHPGLVKRLFELEVPEIYDGTVEVKSIAREAGSGSTTSSRSSRARRWTSSNGPRTRRFTSPPPCPRRTCSVSPPRRRPRPAAWWSPTTSSPWPSARRARMPVLPPSSPAGRLISSPRPPPSRRKRTSSWRTRRRTRRTPPPQRRKPPPLRKSRKKFQRKRRRPERLP